MMPTIRCWPLLVLTSVASTPALAAAPQGIVPTADDGRGVAADEEGESQQGALPSGEEGSHHPSGFAHGVRVGLSLPWGDADGGYGPRTGAMGGIVGLRVPLWIDLGYQLDSHWWTGIHAQLGLGSTGEDCSEGAECEWSDLRVGLQLLYSPQTPAVGPWLGGLLGWESLRSSASVTLQAPVDGEVRTVSVTAREVLGGPSLGIQGGWSFATMDRLSVGPYLSLAATTFLLQSVTCPQGLQCDDTDPDVKLHGWASLGVRGSYGP